MTCTHPITLAKGSPHEFRVPCRKCVNCRIARSREWAIRCLNETVTCGASCFITLTYEDLYVPFGGTLRRDEVRKFMKRLRRRISPKKVKFYGCGEYGEKNNRPHYHLLVFGWEPPFDDLDFSHKPPSSSILKELWPYGFNTVGTVTYDSARYCADYIFKAHLGKSESKFERAGVERPFQIWSRGIGLDYFEHNFERLFNDGVVFQGKSIGLPAYYKKKLNMDDEQKNLRATLALLTELEQARILNLSIEEYREVVQKHNELQDATTLSKRRLFSKGDL